MTIENQNASNIDWTSLKKQAEPYTNLVTETDPVSGLVDITYYGLQANLSDILKNAPSSGIHSLAVFTDTLVIDIPGFKTSGLLLAARNLDVSGLNEQPLVLTPFTEGDLAVQILAGAATGGTFSLCVKGQESDAVKPPTGTDTLNVTGYILKDGEKLSELPDGNSHLSQIIGSSWMVNSLYADFSAAAWLMDDTSNDALTTSQSMLDWVIKCITGLETDKNLPGDLLQLYNQTAALLITLNAAPGAMFVPILSESYYGQHTSDIINVIRDYENKMMTLDTEQDIKQAIATVSSTLEKAAAGELSPLQVQLQSLSENTDSLKNDIQNLQVQLSFQQQRAHSAFGLMIDAITISNIKQQLTALLDFAMNLISVGFDFMKLEKGDFSIIKDGITALRGFVTAINSGQSGGGGDLTDQATKLLETQIVILETVMNASSLYEQALKNQSADILPSSLSAITIDPATDWDNYIASAEAKISNIKMGIDSSAQKAANNYLASLKILAGYGKAIGGKFVAYVSQLVEASIVISQIKSAQDVEKNWAETEAKTTSEEEKLAALKVLVQGRLQAIKRSLFLSWKYYEASYFYLNFQSPPHVLKLDMSASELEAALVGVAEWVAQATGSSPDGQHVQLPNSNAEIELQYRILYGNETNSDDSDKAVLTRLDNGNWSLDFNLNIGTSQLDGVLPNNGKVAIWITEAQFFLDDVKPDSKGNIIAVVSTSGTYQNGIGNTNPYTFVTKGLSGNYAYRVSDQNVYSPWEINSAVYMTPTPYTQWNITIDADSGDPSEATLLHVKLKIAYKSA